VVARPSVPCVKLSRVPWLVVAVEVALTVGEGVDVAVPVGLAVALWVGDGVGLALVARWPDIRHKKYKKKGSRMGREEQRAPKGEPFRKEAGTLGGDQKQMLKTCC
jgi:hypothetical protein